MARNLIIVIAQFAILLPATGGLLQLHAERQTIFVLVDESGSLKADRAGWRKDAASLLAFSLGNGSSMSMSGFGDQGRALELAPLLLDNTAAGLQHREMLARSAGTLHDSDRNTDLFGAIHQALTEVSKLDPAVRRSAPPALVILSDFVPDPRPSLSAQELLCGEINASHLDLVEIGFGKFDDKTAGYLAQCAGTKPWGVVIDPAAMPDIFWNLQNRFTRSLKILDGTPRNGAITVPVPEWAEEVLVLGISESGSNTETWNWHGQRFAEIHRGDRYRLGRIAASATYHSPVLQLQFSGNIDHVRIIAVARGQLAARITARPSGPWFRSELISFNAELISSRSGVAVNDWQSAAEPQSVAEVKMPDGSIVPLGFDPTTKSFTGTARFDSSGAAKATTNISVDGATWTGDIEGSVMASPIDLGSAGDGRLTLSAWIPGQRMRTSVKSTVPNREFDVMASGTGSIAASPAMLHFGPANVQSWLQLTAAWPRADWKTWFSDLPPLTGEVVLNPRLKSGVATPSLTLPVVVRLKPLWQRASAAVILLAFPLTLIMSLVRGRRLPPWVLVPIRADGRISAAAEPIHLRNYRRQLDLKGHGMPGAVIVQPFREGTSVRLSGEAGLRDSSGLAVHTGRFPVAPGDTLQGKSADGGDVLFKIEKF